MQVELAKVEKYDTNDNDNENDNPQPWHNLQPTTTISKL